MIPYCKSVPPDKNYLDKYLFQIEQTGILTNDGPLSNELKKRIETIAGRPSVPVSSGTIGLYLSLISSEKHSAGEKVIIPSYNFSAGLQAVHLAGMKPVFVDIDGDYGMNLNHLSALLETHKNCRYVIAVNYYGWAGNPGEIEQVIRSFERASGRKIYLIFDSAHAFGAAYNKRPIGSFGDFEVFSFSATKVIGGGEGGAVTCASHRLLKNVEIAKNYGTRDYCIVGPGINGKISEPNCAYILAKMDDMDDVLSKRNQKAHSYMEKLENMQKLIPPVINPAWDPVFKDMVVQISFDGSDSRDALREKLRKDGIDTRVYFYPPLHHSCRDKDNALDLHCTESTSKRILALPFYEGMTEETINYIVDRLTLHLS